MITTLFFIQLIALQIWYVTSGQVEHHAPSAYLTGILRNRQTYRIGGMALMLIATVVFIVRLGWMSGICAGMVGLMGGASLVVLVNPFRYVNGKAVVMLYVFFLMLEFLI